MFVKNKKVELKEKKKMEEKVKNIYVGCNKDTAVIWFGFSRRNPETGVLERFHAWFDNEKACYEFIRRIRS